MTTVAEVQDTVTQETIKALQKAYSMEVETVANYMADSVNLDGVRAEEVKKSLAAEIQEELGHAQRLAHRIKQLGGHVPGPTDLEITHSHMAESTARTDLVSVIRSVIEDEAAAIEHYKTIIRETDGKDFVTQDLCIQLLGDEEEHHTLFSGFLKEYEQ